MGFSPSQATFADLVPLESFPAARDTRKAPDVDALHQWNV